MSEIPLRAAAVEGGAEEASARSHAQWVAQDDYRMLSMAFTIKSMDGVFAESLRWHLRPFLLERPAPGGLPVELITEEATSGTGYTFRFATQERFRSRMLADAIAKAVWDLHRAVHEQVRDFVLLHAAAVVRDGRALLLPATTGSGKSSLTLGLLGDGFSYLSDDVGPLDPVTQRAHAFPKRIKVIPDTLGFFPGLEERLEDRMAVPFRLWERFVRPEDVGAEVADPTDVGWLVFPSSDFGGRARLSPITKAESVEAMAACCFNLFRYGERGVVLLSRIAKEAEAFRLEGGSVRERVALLRDRLR
jgi:hypothetical protein